MPLKLDRTLEHAILSSRLRFCSVSCRAHEKAELTKYNVSWPLVGTCPWAESWLQVKTYVSDTIVGRC